MARLPKAKVAPEISLTLFYSITGPKEATLTAIERNGEPVGDEGEFQLESDGFIAFQLLLCRSRLAKIKGEKRAFKLVEPRRLTSPLYHAVRYEGGWRNVLIGKDVFPYLKASKTLTGFFPAYIKPMLVPEIKIENGLGKPHDAEDKELEIIIASLEDEDKSQTIDLSVTVQSPSLDDEWPILGTGQSEKSVYYGCSVQIEVIHDNRKQPLVYWLSNQNIFELFPSKDQRLYNVSNPQKTKIGNRQKIVIGGDPPIPILTKTGIEACMVVISKQEIDLDKLRKKISTFFKGKPVNSFKWDQGPIKRFFNGKIPDKFMSKRFGNPPNKRKCWSTSLLYEVLPESSTAVILTMPNRRKD